MPDETPNPAADRQSRRWARRGAMAAIAAVLAFLGAPALAGVPARLVRGCGVWIAGAIILELLSAVGFVVFFKLVFAAPISWRRSMPAALRALGARTILPAGGLIGPTVGAWSASTEKPSVAQLTRSTVTFVIITNAPAAIALAMLGTLLSLGLPGGPHDPALTLLPASLAAAFLAASWLAARSATPHPARAPGTLRQTLTKSTSAVGDGVSEARALVGARNWKLTGAVAYFAFDSAVLWAAFHAYGHTPPIPVIAMGYLIGSLAGALPIPAGLGAVDGGLIGALALYGAPIAPAAAAVLLYRGISLALAAALGTLGWMRSGTDRSLRVGGRPRRRFGAARMTRRAAPEVATAPVES